MHRGEHAHVHDGAESVGARRSAKGARSFSLTPWALFLIFVLGPCEPLIPVLMYPAARHSLTGVVVATVVFGITTITTMMLTTALGYRSLTEFRLARLEPYVHAIAGLAVVACGLAVHLGL
jgi:sulfite exporter TauE/SafE